MCDIVIIDKSRDGIVLPTHHHSRGCLFWCEGLGVERPIGCVWRKGANHLLILTNRDTLPFDLLDILQARQDLVLDLEFRLHSVCTTFLDDEGLLLQLFDRAGLGQVNNNRRATFDFLGAWSETTDDQRKR